ncbi:hypothetical protein HYFRA_00012015 [Hymenoscyphus fraxineus]|uniref:Uncharacterized protein n=1 Tax=Hymenoscyphus fraxineus TaxID=746836 RepID=A0A9N9L0N7_9HELO|nr:hypothetical protein HYFRA_00012015 [Hymenoscyphus fraxineus]
MLWKLITSSEVIRLIQRSSPKRKESYTPKVDSSRLDESITLAGQLQSYSDTSRGDNHPEITIYSSTPRATMSYAISSELLPVRRTADPLTWIQTLFWSGSGIRVCIFFGTGDIEVSQASPSLICSRDSP